MTMTVAQVADLAQLALNDTAEGVWPQATIEAWVREAVRDYEARTQWISTADLTLATGTRDYNLPANTWDVLSVRYPVSGTPPQYLSRGSHTDPAFYLSGDYYDWTPSRSADTVPVLHLSASPTTGQHALVTCSSLYYPWSPDTSGSDVLVVDAHIPVLVRFIVWKAFQERLRTHMSAAAAAAYPSVLPSVVAELNTMVEQAYACYWQALTTLPPAQPDLANPCRT